MTPHAHTRLQTELAALRRSGPSIEVPDDYMDYEDNLVARHVARQLRIRQIQDLLTKPSSVRIHPTTASRTGHGADRPLRRHR
jgi:hypothetical protein